jgi:hypothetical protein
MPSDGYSPETILRNTTGSSDWPPLGRFYFKEILEEQEEFEINRKAVDLYVNLSDMTEQIRRWRKHGHRFKDVDELLDALWEDCIDHSLIN